MEEIVKDESSIKYCGIRVDASNIKLIEEKAVARVIPKEKISQINIIKGSAAKRPWVAVLIAMALIIMVLFLFHPLLDFSLMVNQCLE